MGLTKEAEDFLKRVGDTDMEIPDRTHTRKIFQLTECSDNQLAAPEYRGVKRNVLCDSILLRSDR